MVRTQLNQKILKKLAEKTGNQENSIRSMLSMLKQDYPGCTLNALAQIYAKTKGFSVMQMLSQEDKNTIGSVKVVKPSITVKQNTSKRKESIKQLLNYDTDDFFKKGHIEEVNRAYTFKCYTSAHILSRKIIENLIREILSKKFPPSKKENKELYYSISQGRFKDFSIILKNLYEKRNKFGIDKSQMIERLYKKAKKFKDDANDATHSWYTLITRKKEIDDLEIQSMLELIKKLEK